MNWRTIAFVLENTVFLLIGLQAQWLFGDVGDSELSTPAHRRGLRRRPWSAVVVLRIVWVMVVALPAGAARGRTRTSGTRRRGPSRSSSAGPGCAAWSRWRRRSSSPRQADHREILLLIAFTTVAGHAVPPGPLPGLGGAAPAGAVAGPDGRRAGPGDDPAAGLEGRASRSSTGSSSRTRTGSASMIRQRIDRRNFAAWERLGTVADQETPDRAVLADPARR